jgi:hypothetical protein
MYSKKAMVNNIKHIKVKVIINILEDAKGNISTCVIGDYSDSICVGGIGKDGNYHQYDSYEGIHAYGWAEKLGMKMTCQESMIDIFV